MTDVIYINGTGPYAYEFTEDTDYLQMEHYENKKPDPHWFVLDDNGHFHAFNMELETLPTLRYMDGVICANDETVTLEYRCVLCEDLVVPHFFPGGLKTTTIEGPRSAGFTIPRYNRSIDRNQLVSFYTQNMFGIARVVAFGIEKLWDGQTVSATFQCDFVVRRQNDL
jgi:hypothetical protein